VIIGGVLVGLAIFVLVLTLFPATRVAKSRLGIEQASVRKRATGAMDRFLDKRGNRNGLALQLSLAGFSIDPGSFVLLVGVVALVLGLVGLVIHPLIGLVVFALTLVVARAVVANKAQKRQAAFTEQLPGVLKLLTSSLKAGFGFIQALGAVAEEADEPARGEFERVLAEQRLGIDLVVALYGMAQRMDSVDMEWVASAIDIQRDTGGNLSEILDNVQVTIRERLITRRQIKSLTAEGRLSAKILTGLPLGLGVILSLIHPGYFAPLTDGKGVFLLGIGAVFLVLGNISIRKIVNIKL